MYDNITSRSDADGLIPEGVSKEIIQGVTEQSAALQLFRQVRMSTKTHKQPVLQTLPVAYWVDGDTGLKKTTEVAWGKKTLTAEEIAVIVPIPKTVLDDSDYDIWAEAKPLIAEAFARRLDGSIFLGIAKPTSFPEAIAPAAIAAGNTIDVATNNAANAGIIGDIADLMSKIEEDGYDVNGYVAPKAIRGLLRKARATDGQRLLDVDPTGKELDGNPIVYAMKGLWTNPATSDAVRLIAGDFTAGIVGVRQDINYEIFKEGAIFDDEGNVIFNLLQQDMIAMRCTARYAFQVANPVNYDEETEADRYPFGVLQTA